MITSEISIVITVLPIRWAPLYARVILWATHHGASTRWRAYVAPLGIPTNVSLHNPKISYLWSLLTRVSEFLQVSPITPKQEDTRFNLTSSKNNNSWRRKFVDHLTSSVLTLGILLRSELKAQPTLFHQVATLAKGPDKTGHQIYLKSSQDIPKYCYNKNVSVDLSSMEWSGFNIVLDES